MLTRYDLAAALIRTFEGIKFDAYQDSGGVWTIGIGHTHGVKRGDHCDAKQAALWFQQDAAPLWALVEPYEDLKAAALVSFGFNVGIGILKNVLVAGQLPKMLEYVHDHHGNVLPGLEARRALEFALCQVNP